MENPTVGSIVSFSIFMYSITTVSHKLVWRRSTTSTSQTKNRMVNLFVSIFIINIYFLFRRRRKWGERGWEQKEKMKERKRLK